MSVTTMKAVKCVSPGKAEVKEVPLPRLRDDCVLVKVHCFALNPTDWQHIDMMSRPGHTVGCDFAGVVEAIGSKVTKAWKKGDRIAGFTHGVNSEEPEDGCLAEYCVAKGDLQVKIPDHMSFEDACSVGVAIATCGLVLYRGLGLPLPETKPASVPLLVYGGSSAMGSFAIQYGKLSGCEVVTTCSEANFDFVKSLGASAAFSYKDPDCGKKIREHTHDKLTLAMDCIAQGDTTLNIVSDAMSSKGGKVMVLQNAEYPRPEVQAELTVGYTIFGEAFSYGPYPIPVVPGAFEFGKEFYQLSEKLLAEGKLKPHPPEIMDHGFDAVFVGLQRLREGKVSGKKLVGYPN